MHSSVASNRCVAISVLDLDKADISDENSDIEIALIVTRRRRRPFVDKSSLSVYSARESLILQIWQEHEQKANCYSEERFC